MPELVPPDDIRQYLTKVDPQTRELIAGAQEIYLKTIDTPGIFPTTYSYLEALAQHQQSNPLDVLAVSIMMDQYPQLSIDVVSDIGVGKITLPMKLIEEKRKAKVKLALNAGSNLAEDGAIFKKKAEQVLRMVPEWLPSSGPAPEELVEVSEQMKQQMPEDFIEEAY